MNAQCAKFIDDQQILHWQHYQRKRLQLLDAEAKSAQEKEEKRIAAAAASPADAWLVCVAN